MDVLKYLQNGGNVVSNPKYNAKTKEGRLQKPTLTTFKPGDNIVDQALGASAANAASMSYHLNQYDIDKYADYNVYVNPIQSEEELNKERARNQSALEQTGRMVGQMVGSEVVLGTLRGLSDIVDFGVELFSGDKDFTNPVSKFFEDAQNDLRERLEIYRENPNAAWDITDYGWWTNSMVSIASTLSLAIPGGIYAKALSLAAKSMKASKALRAGLKLVSKHPNIRTKQIEATTSLLTHAGLMRIGEGYIEARDTYNQVKDELNIALQQLTPEQLAAVRESNPSYKDLTIEQIAEKAAGDSADDVFKDDMWLMLLDAWQLKSLRNLGKGFKNMSTTASLRQAQKESIAQLRGGEILHTSKFKNYFSNLNAGSFSVFGSELSEGFEEAYQYIQQQEGVDKARKVVDPNYKARGYAEYITDPHMWEQAFWGWMGGVAFQTIGSATNAGWAKLSTSDSKVGQFVAKYIGKNEDMMTKKRKAEIDSRIAIITQFEKDVRTIRDEKKNPFSNLEEKPDIIDEDEKDALIEYAFEKLVTDLTINAATAGNYDLLKEFLSTEEFQEHMNKLGVIDNKQQKEYIANIVQHMNNVYDMFEGEIDHIISNDVVNEGIINKIARDNTYLKLAKQAAKREIDAFDQQILDAKTRFADDSAVLELIDAAEQSITLEMYKIYIDEINNKIKELDAQLKTKTINRAVHNSRVTELMQRKQALYRDLNFTTEENITDSMFNDYYYDNIDNSAIDNIQYVDNTVFDAIQRKVSNKANSAMYYNLGIVSTKKDIQQRAKKYENMFKALADKRLQDAIKQLDDIYENNDIDTVLDYMYGDKYANLTDEVKESIDKALGDIKVYDDTYEDYAHIIVGAAEKKAKEKGQRPTATVNGNPVNTPPTNPVPPHPVTPSVNPSNNSTPPINPPINPTPPPSSTGGQTPQQLGISTVEDEEENQVQLSEEQKVLSQVERDDVGATINEEVKQIGIAGMKDDSFKALTIAEKIEYIKEQLRHKGHAEKDINDNENLIKSWVKIIQGNINIRRSAINLDTITNSDIVDIAALGIDLTDEFFETAIKRFKLDNQMLEINGKVYFNMISFLKYLVNSNEITNFEILKTVYKAFYEYVIQNDKYLNNPTLRLNDATLNKIIENMDLNPVEEDNRIGMAKKGYRDETLFPIAMNKIKVGDVLRVEVETQQSRHGAIETGINFYKTIVIGGRPIDVKVGFNAFAEKIITGEFYNNGYRIKSGALTYIIWQDANGQYHSQLDEAFDELMANENELSNDALEVLEYILTDKYSRETYNQLINNSLFKKFFKHASNQNVNYESVKEVLKQIRTLYNYNYTGDHTDKRFSYKTWVEKAYNNYKFTDDLRNVKQISVNFISEGTQLTGEHNYIDKAVVDFNLANHHLGFVTGNETVRDVTTGDEKQAPGFRHRGLVVIVPNGTKAPAYCKIYAQKVDYTSKFGKAVRDEIKSIISRHVTGEDNYDTTLKKLISIFNYSGIVGDVVCKEYEGRIIISTPDNEVPIITIYKKRPDNVTDSTGINVNLGKDIDSSVGAIDMNPETENLIEQGLNKLLANSTFALSYDLMDSSPTANVYVTKHSDGKLEFNIGGQTFTYDNYLDYIIKNNVGKINLQKLNLGYGVSTNFAPQEGNQLWNANIRGIPIAEETPRRGSTTAATSRVQAVKELEDKGNKTNKSTRELIKVVAPTFFDGYKVLNEDKFFGAKVDIKVEDKKDSEGRPVRAEYNRKTKKITLYKAFFDEAKRDNGDYQAMRILVHENIHRTINEINNPFEREDFIDGLREIRDIFIDALTTGTSRNDALIEYLISKKLDVQNTINGFKSLFDNNNSELYNLEEFIAESLTSKLLQDVLNNIESSRAVSVQTENLTLWQKIIQAIRKLFGFGDIKDNTLLAQEFEIFADNFKFDKNNRFNLETEDTVNYIDDVEDDNDEDYDGEYDGTGDETFDDEYDDDISLSAINLDDVPNIVAATNGLSIAERAEFDRSLNAGELQMYCK